MKKRFFEIAKLLATKSNHPKHKLGAVLVLKGKIVGLGFNKSKTHTKSPHPWKNCHAEFDAILSCDKNNIKNSVMYIYRETKDGVPAMARCCDSCMELLKKEQIKKICYTNEGKYEEEYL